MNKMLLSIGFAAVAGISSVAFDSAYAADYSPVVSTSVQYLDLNLSTPTGAEQMLHRIKAAAHRVCNPEPALQALSESAEWRTCMTTSVSDAVRRLDSPMVTAAYAGRTQPTVVLAQYKSH
ncbi:MAG: UrcA family protein [Caulobacteraceae bacterium]|nr:UrcA family protein [Caulobacteraceae bacterium]